MSEQQKAKKRRGWIWKVALVWVVGSFAIGMYLKPSPSADKETAKKTAASRRQSAERIAFGVKALATLKASLRDPDSLKIETLRVDNGLSLACIEYQAKNGFGGMNREFVLYVNGKSARDIKSWNKKCVQELFDVKDEVAHFSGYSS